MRLGIDFGTTRTVVACCDRGNYPIVGFVGEGGEGEAVEWFPSLVAERAGELRFGLAAQAAAADPSWTIVRSFKRHFGGPGASLTTEIDVGSIRLPVMELAVRFLTALREAILHGSNLPKTSKKKSAKSSAASPEIEAVVAVPANAHGTQRFLTIEAFRRAGFVVRSLLNEPSAAGFEYTHRYRNTINSKREHIVVYDLGGGTFDASLVSMAGARHEAIATAGINHLGGDDFDELLATMALGARSLPPAERARFVERCREAKESLNANSRRIVIETDAGDEITVAVADFYERCAPLVAASVEAMAPVMAILDREDGGPESGLAGIYVVGGGSALPIVGRVLKDRFGRRVHRSPYPFAATAIGLAIAADDESTFELADRLSRNFGVFREAEQGARVAFDPIFTKDTPIPHETTEDSDAALKRVYRAAHNVGHFRFVECAAFDETGTPRGDITPFGDVLFPFDPALRGRRDLRAVPIQRTAGEGPMIEERYWVDEAGIVQVKITDLADGYAERYRLGG